MPAGCAHFCAIVLRSPRFVAAVLLLVVLAELAVAARQPEVSNPASPVELAALPGTFRLSDRLLSGPRPNDDDAFAALVKLGVKTILSVDGIPTDVESARRHGIRYVHLPVPYKQMERQRALEIVKAATSLPGPVYLHCHHGKHRGPSAAALVLISQGDWRITTARAWLEQAGTSPDYPGLWHQIERFAIPTRDELAAIDEDFAECVPPKGLAAAMVEIESLWEAAPAEGAAASRPDALADIAQLMEAFHELSRQDDSIAKGDEFLAALQEAETAARELYQAARDGQNGNADSITQGRQRVEKSCKDCHARHRDR